MVREEGIFGIPWLNTCILPIYAIHIIDTVEETDYTEIALGRLIDKDTLKKCVRTARITEYAN